MMGLVEGMVYAHKTGLDVALYLDAISMCNRCSTNSVKFAAPSLAPSSSNGEEKESKSTCHNGLCKQHLGAVVGVFTLGEFVLALFVGALIWLYSKMINLVSKL